MFIVVFIVSTEEVIITFPAQNSVVPFAKVGPFCREYPIVPRCALQQFNFGGAKGCKVMRGQNAIGLKFVKLWSRITVAITENRDGLAFFQCHIWQMYQHRLPFVVDYIEAGAVLAY